MKVVMRSTNWKFVSKPVPWLKLSLRLGDTAGKHAEEVILVPKDVPSTQKYIVFKRNSDQTVLFICEEADLATAKEVADLYKATFTLIELPQDEAFQVARIKEKEKPLLMCRKGQDDPMRALVFLGTYVPRGSAQIYEDPDLFGPKIVLKVSVANEGVGVLELVALFQSGDILAVRSTSEHYGRDFLDVWMWTQAGGLKKMETVSVAEWEGRKFAKEMTEKTPVDVL